MFLAIKEMRDSKLRYSLIIGIMFLISYVVFILSGLAFGLAEEFSMAIEDWQASEVILSEDSNKTFTASMIPMEDYDKVDQENKAPIGLLSGVIQKEGEKQNVTVFGTSDDAFLLPEILEGKSFAGEDEIIISQNLADKGYHIGDELEIGNVDKKLQVVGIFKESYYTVSPIIYTSIETWQSLKYKDQKFEEDKAPINAIVLKTSINRLPSTTTDLEKMSSEDFIENIPGYSAQNITLKAMIYFLFVVAAAIIGIFLYVITLQKTAIFGVLKVQGISNGFLTKSILAQSFLVGLIGDVLAFVLAFLTSWVLPEAMPFAINWSLWFLYAGILLVVANLGGLFSLGTVTKVDPITAVGGGN